MGAVGGSAEDGSLAQPPAGKCCSDAALSCMMPAEADRPFLGKRKDPVMRSRTKILVVLLVCLVGIGFWRGWFSVSRPKSDTEGDKVNVNMSVDKGKIKSDIKKVERKVEKGVSELEGKGKAKEAK
jgi:hypothetical protein